MYPHTISNGAGEELTFLRVTHDDRGPKLEVENRVGPGAGPPMHAHLHQEESLTVVEGRMGYQEQGGETRYAEAGESVVFGPGVAHRFWNAGTEDLRCTGYIRPPDNLEFFLSELFGSQARNGGSRPDPFEAAWLTTRYRSEFRTLAIPGVVQTLLFPLLVAVGRLLGKYRRYADAPAPRVN